MTDKLIIAFNITKSYDLLKRGKGDRNSIYDCTRRKWVINKSKAELAELVFGVAHGKVVGVYRPTQWEYIDPTDKKSRVMFEGEELSDSPYIGLDLSEYFCKVRNPIRYFGCW